jgi:hypothetical protein
VQQDSACRPEEQFGPGGKIRQEVKLEPEWKNLSEGERRREGGRRREGERRWEGERRRGRESGMQARIVWRGRNFLKEDPWPLKGIHERSGEDRL